ncbi:MAG: hypothetical protein KKC23_02050 [Proteobacteria bacterium]|nr:hypothetical protein [Pseudomonadota bacterium]
MKKIILVILLLTATSAFADEMFPQKGWTERPDPIASQYAVAGGGISIFAGQYPKSLNYYIDNNVLSAEIFGALYETLLSINPVTLEYEPGIAEKWVIMSRIKLQRSLLIEHYCRCNSSGFSDTDLQKLKFLLQPRHSGLL